MKREGKMSEAEPCCQECSRQYGKLLSSYWYQRRQIRKMRKAFAAIEDALTHKREHAAEFIVGAASCLLAVASAFHGPWTVLQIAADCAAVFMFFLMISFSARSAVFLSFVLL